MRPKLFALMIIAFFTVLHSAKGQTTAEFADSIRLAYNIPEIGYAVVSSTKILDLQLIGIKRINSSIKADFFVIAIIISYLFFLSILIINWRP